MVSNQATSMDFADLRREWWDQVTSHLAWRRTERKAKTLDTPTPGCWVRADGNQFSAYLKPHDAVDHPVANPAVRTIAAREKIASDLAYLLELPVPPVLLYVNPTTRPGGIREAMLSIDLYEVGYRRYDLFELDKQWLSDRALVDKHLVSALPTCGALLAFDAWLDQRDHRNPDQVFVLKAEVNASDVRVTSLDYANSMGWPERWRSGGWKNSQRTLSLLIVEENGTEERRRLAQRIRDLPAATITTIVDRIPAAYLAEDAKADILRGLLGRRSLIADFFK